MSPTPSPAAPPDPRRQRWLSVLAKAPADRLGELFDSLTEALGPLPAHEILRRPEIGLVMVRGRISGSGAPFCAGEMTTTRAAVRLDSGEVGIGYVAGRHSRQAEIVAILDALGQGTSWREPIESLVVAPLEAEAMLRHQAQAARAAATRVEFFTVAREGGA
ncbi:MAG: phosphonate C-P lyase system protein PhnG [Proteobacteria bacterium]|nr:phosphonate C-P lyase system protein PhnG [Pseudomonadota bacterium]